MMYRKPHAFVVHELKQWSITFFVSHNYADSFEVNEDYELAVYYFTILTESYVILDLVVDEACYRALLISLGAELGYIEAIAD